MMKNLMMRPMPKLNKPKKMPLKLLRKLKPKKRLKLLLRLKLKKKRLPRSTKEL